MLNLCSQCDQLIEDKDAVQVTVQSQYKSIKSPHTFALYEDGMSFDNKSMRHMNCNWPKSGGPDGD